MTCESLVDVVFGLVKIADLWTIAIATILLIILDTSRGKHYPLVTKKKPALREVTSCRAGIIFFLHFDISQISAVWFLRNRYADQVQFYGWMQIIATETSI